MKRFFASLFAFSLCLVAAPAAQADTPAGPLSINQWVRVQDGIVRGTVVAPKLNGTLDAVAGVEVVISRRDGMNFRAPTDEQGQFVIGDMEPGVYAMSVWQGKVIAACALQVIDASHDPNGEYPSSALVSIADIDRPTIKTAIIRYLPAGVRTAPQFLSGIDFAGLAGKVRPSGNTLRVSQSNGSLKGRLFLAGATGAELQGAAMANVFVMKDGNQVDRALTNEQGEFVFEQLMPGVYSMLAVGPGGVGLIGFELTSDVSLNRTSLKETAGAEQLVSTLQEAFDELSMQLAPVPEVIDSMDSLMEEEVEIIETEDGVPLVIDASCDECLVEPIADGCCTPVCGGGVHGGFAGGGGGGGGGGFGGFGALIGLGAIAATTSNDDNLVLIPPTASPVAP